MAYMQQNRLIAIDTPLGADALLLQGFTGQEGMSQLFHFHLDLLSENPAIPFNRIVGQRVTLHILLPDGSQRSINGCVSRFAQTGNDMRFTHYRAEVVPWLWFLTRTADCRIEEDAIRLTAQKIEALDGVVANAAAGLRVFVGEAAALKSLRGIIARDGPGRGRVSVVVGLEPTREVEITLPGAYKIGPGIRAAVKSLPGILDVHDI